MTDVAGPVGAASCRIGLNLNPFLWPTLAERLGLRRPVLVRRLVERIVELGITTVRVPIDWERLARIEDDRRTLDGEAVSELAGIVSVLSEADIEVLAALVSPPPEVAVDYFHDQSVLGDRLQEFLRSLLGAVPGLGAWDIWNEPNASDFYLSVADGDWHRPWNASEFVRDVLRPARQALLAHDPGIELCAVSFAENGIVGHDDRPPAIANRLLRDRRFDRFRSQDPHGHFYFVPDFAAEFLAAASIDESAIVGVHPYPYFRIWQDRDPALVDRTRRLVEAFRGLADLGDRRVWITEVGARSFDVLDQNRWDEGLQAEFTMAMVDLAADTAVERLYVYKLIDVVSDLRQEKSFGLIDHAGRAKEAFHRLRVAITAADAGPLTVARLGGGHDDPAEGLADPTRWRVEHSSPFSFLAPDRVSGRAAVLVSPGRNRGDRLEIRPARRFEAEGTVEFELGLAPFGPWRSVALHFDADTPSETSDVVVSMEAGGPVQLFVGGTLVPLPDSVAGAFEPQRITGVRVAIGQDEVTCQLVTDVAAIHRTVPTDRVRAGLPGEPRVTVVAGGRPPGAISIHELAIFGNGRGHLSTTSDRFVRPTADLPSEWQLSMASRSQIDQEVWVALVYGLTEPGFFIEIGAGDGLNNSNSAMLERRFGWRGMLIEANPHRFCASSQNRSCVVVHAAASEGPSRIVEFVDAGDLSGIIDYLQDDVHAESRRQRIRAGHVVQVRTEPADVLFERYGAPESIHYLSVDTEGNELEVLESINFDRWRVGLVTVEHAGVTAKRNQVVEYLESRGFRRYPMWFEDWYVDPGTVGDLLGISADEALQRAEWAIACLPLHRAGCLLESGKERRRRGDHEGAAYEFAEGARPAYPNNAQLVVEAGRSWRESGHLDRSQQILETGRVRFPNHPGIARQQALTLAAAGEQDGFVEAALRFRRLGGDPSRDGELTAALERFGLMLDDLGADGT